MKKTQKSIIFSFLSKNPDSTPKEIAQSLKFPSPSVRRVLFTLRQEGIVSKPNPLHTAEVLSNKKARQFGREVKLIVPKVPKKLVSDRNKFVVNHVLYCQGQIVTYEALTFSDVFLNVRRLMIEMAELIESETSDNCSPIRDNSGMEISPVFRMPFEYPEIRIRPRRGRFI